MWQVAPYVYVGVPVHSARSRGRLFFGLFLFKHPGLTLHCPSLSPPSLPGSGEGSLERKDGMALAQGLGEAREGPSHPSFLPFKNWFCPLKPFRTNLDTASCNHTMRSQWAEEEEDLQHRSALLKVPTGPAGHQTPLHFPSSTSTPAQRTTAGSKHALLHPNTSTEHVPVPPTPTVVQRPRAELVCT